MPLTVITLKKVPQSLRGDLTKWMQEIETGVYIGNFNSKVREALWKRVKENIEVGEATLTFACRNEIGYSFDTVNSNRTYIDSDGIPLVIIPNKEENVIENNYKFGFSNAYKFHKAKMARRIKKKNADYVVIDIETTGLDNKTDSIIEIGAIKLKKGNIEEFSCLISIEGKISDDIQSLTGITDKIIGEEGLHLEIALDKFINFIGNEILVGYNIEFDISFLNNKLEKLNHEKIKNKRYDLMKFVKNEKLFLSNYKLQTVVKEYGINEKIKHRAKSDAKIIYKLSTKVNEFQKFINKN